MTIRAGPPGLNDFPPIGSLSAIGDNRSLALVAPDGNLEWYCPRRFDAPPLLWSLLDRDRGGRLRIAPSHVERTRVRYLADTAVLQFEWRTAEGEATATLCMDWPGPTDQQRLLWVIHGISGHLDFTIRFDPAGGFGLEEYESFRSQGAIDLVSHGHHLRFQSPSPMQQEDRGWRGQFKASAGNTFGFCLTASLAPDTRCVSLSPSAIVDRTSGTIAAWRAWTKRLSWSGRYRDAVVRSAITLKLLIYEPTGAVVAAGTTSLPAQIGGAGNWDYRFTWFRDAGLTLNALFNLGCRREAHRWAEWMQNVIQRHGTPLRVLYTVDGELTRPEATVDVAQGYKESRPVRIGNAAEHQSQLDVYGELLECVYICDSMADRVLLDHWSHMRASADFIAAHWRDPGEGIWEQRGTQRHFVHSKVMAWTGLQRALWLQRRHALPADTDTWAREADLLREEVLRRGVSQDGKRFVRAYGDEEVDASLLLIARTGFVEGSNPLFTRTVETIRQVLDAGGGRGLIRRSSEPGDGVTAEAAFTICSFWLVEALVAIGRRNEAQVLFEELLSLGGDHGIYAEQVDPLTGEHLGNYPQAFSHVGLINAAMRLIRS